MTAQGLGQLAGPVLKNAISSPVLRGALTGALGGAGGGYTGGFMAGLAATGNFKAAHQSGMKGLAMGLGLGAAMGAGSGYAEAVSNEINPWTGKYRGAPEAMQRIEVNALPQTPREDLIIEEQQSWAKFGEHFEDFNLTYGKNGKVIYENMAREAYRNYDRRIQYSNTSPMYPGETHFYYNNNLLRLDPSGKFRSFYPIKP